MRKGSPRFTIAPTTTDQRYIGREELREFIPVSDMTIWRWMRDPKVAFPTPAKLGANGRNFWWMPSIREWQARRDGRTAT
jgi:predicted DNA-binding transcriptional regulator AlpA